MRLDVLKPIFEGKRPVILGFGREGKVWLDILRYLRCCPEIAIADMNPIDVYDLRMPNLTAICGAHYL